MPDPAPRGTTGSSSTLLDRLLNLIERAGNKLPDPAMLFVLALLVVWVLSALLAPVAFAEIDPRNQQPIRVQNLLTGAALAAFLANMVNVFVNFPPLGIVLVAMLGVGVAEHVGFIGAGLKAMLNITPRALLTPMLILVACLSHTDRCRLRARDPARRHHLLYGRAASARRDRGRVRGCVGRLQRKPHSLRHRPAAAGLYAERRPADRSRPPVNPLSNWYFTAASTGLVVLLGWYLTDRIVEPRVSSLGVDGDTADMPKLEPLSPAEQRGLTAGGSRWRPGSSC